MRQTGKRGSLKFINFLSRAQLNQHHESVGQSRQPNQEIIEYCDRISGRLMGNLLDLKTLPRRGNSKHIRLGRPPSQVTARPRRHDVRPSLLAATKRCA
jgi:hypothetical protein